jgi:hypothetical protein
MTHKRRDIRSDGKNRNAPGQQRHGPNAAGQRPPQRPNAPADPYGSEAHAPDLRKLSEDYRQRLIAGENARMLHRRDEFRRLGEAVAGRLAEIPAVARIVLFGSTVGPPRKELPRSGRFRRAGIEVWHECRNVNLAVWVDDLEYLETLQQTRRVAVTQALARKKLDVDEQHVDVMVMRGADECLGFLCCFDECPCKGKYDCLMTGCGATPRVKPLRGRQFHIQRVPEDRKTTLYQRGAQSESEGDCLQNGGPAA